MHENSIEIDKDNDSVGLQMNLTTLQSRQTVIKKLEIKTVAAVQPLDLQAKKDYSPSFPFTVVKPSGFPLPSAKLATGIRRPTRRVKITRQQRQLQALASMHKQLYRSKPPPPKPEEDQPKDKVKTINIPTNMKNASVNCYDNSTSMPSFIQEASSNKELSMQLEEHNLTTTSSMEEGASFLRNPVTKNSVRDLMQQNQQILLNVSEEQEQRKSSNRSSKSKSKKSTPTLASRQLGYQSMLTAEISVGDINGLGSNQYGEEGKDITPKRKAIQLHKTNTQPLQEVAPPELIQPQVHLQSINDQCMPTSNDYQELVRQTLYETQEKTPTMNIRTEQSMQEEEPGIFRSLNACSTDRSLTPSPEKTSPSKSPGRPRSGMNNRLMPLRTSSTGLALVRTQGRPASQCLSRYSSDNWQSLKMGLRLTRPSQVSKFVPPHEKRTLSQELSSKKPKAKRLFANGNYLYKNTSQESMDFSGQMTAKINQLKQTLANQKTFLRSQKKDLTVQKVTSPDKSTERTAVFYNLNKTRLYPSAHHQPSGCITLSSEGFESPQARIHRNYIQMLSKSQESNDTGDTLISDRRDVVQPYYNANVMAIIQNFDFERLKKGVFPNTPKVILEHEENSRRVIKRIKRPSTQMIVREEREDELTLIGESSRTSMQTDFNTAILGRQVVGDNSHSQQNKERIATNMKWMKRSKKALRVPDYSKIESSDKDSAAFNSLERSHLGQADIIKHVRLGATRPSNKPQHSAGSGTAFRPKLTQSIHLEKNLKVMADAQEGLTKKLLVAGSCKARLAAQMDFAKLQSLINQEERETTPKMTEMDQARDDYRKIIQGSQSNDIEINSPDWELHLVGKTMLGAPQGRKKVNYIHKRSKNRNFTKITSVSNSQVITQEKLEPQNIHLQIPLIIVDKIPIAANATNTQPFGQKRRSVLSKPSLSPKPTLIDINVSSDSVGVSMRDSVPGPISAIGLVHNVDEMDEVSVSIDIKKIQI